MRVLITGANGMLGRALQRAFLKEPKFEVIQFGRCHADLSTFDGMVKFNEFIKRCDPWWVIHTASIVGGIEMNNQYPYTFNMKNTLINAGVVDSCVRNNIPRFLGILSVCCYGDGFSQEDFPLTEDRLFEREPHKTNAGYAYSKRNLALHILTANQELQKRYNYIISSNLYGEQDFRGYRAHFCSVMIDKVINAVKNNETRVHFAGDGRVKRQYVYVDDLASCIVKHVKLDVDENYNFASEEELSAEDMMKILLDSKKIKLQYDFKNTMVAGQFVRTVAVDKVKKLFPDLEFTPFSEGVVRVYDKWFAEEQI